MTDSVEKTALRSAFAKKLSKTEAASTYIAKSGGIMTGQLVANGGVKGNLDGTASRATADASGNNIEATYATKEYVAANALPEIIDLGGLS